MTTIREDVSPTENASLNVDDATSAFLERWKDPQDEASKSDKGAKTKAHEETEAEVEDEEPVDEQDDEENLEDPDEGTEEDTEEDKADAKDKPKKVAEDDAEVSFTVDGVEHKASVKELKRLAGQEAALTRKSQEVASRTKEVDELRTHHITALNTLVQRAADRYKPFSEIDMLVASKEMSSEDFAAVRSEATAAYADLQFLTEELQGAVAQAQHMQQQDFNARAQECIQVLSDPEKGIKGWNQNLYNEIRTYAKGAGMSPTVVDAITDPVAIKMLHKAMAFDNIKKVATVKKATAPKKVLNSTRSSDRQSKNTPNAKSAMATLKATGSRDAAASAFLSRWTKEDD